MNKVFKIILLIVSLSFISNNSWSKLDDEVKEGNKISIAMQIWMHEKGIEWFYDKKNYASAYKLFKLGANYGYAPSQFMMGLIYENGLSVDKNYLTAFNYYEKAAKQGHSDAQALLANMYRYNQKYTGSANNYKAAKHWYNLAVLQENTFAMRQLGSMLLVQEISKEDFHLLELIEGLMWLNTAFLLKDEKSIKALKNWKQYLIIMSDEEKATLLLKYTKDLAQKCINKSYTNCLTVKDNFSTKK